MNNNWLLPGYKTIGQLENDLKHKPEEYWVKRGENAVLRLFHDIARRVPAYKDFLKKNRIEPKNIRTIEDFKNVPHTSKDGYLRAYPRNMLCWDGQFRNKQWVISTTSGSTGEPFYFPRGERQDRQYALSAELYLRENFQIHKKSTLYIVGFPMGAWIGGLFTYQALKHLTEEGKYNLSIITPGINKLEIIKAISNLGKEFDQIIIGSYAPFLKDVVDEGLRLGLDWHSYNLGLVFSAEGFSEEFRDYVIEKMGLRDPHFSSLNHYGTVDLGTMSHETPISVMIRRLAIKDKPLYESLFGDTCKLPTLTQYLPEMFFFEEDGNNLLCSADSGYPLLRYDLKDHGGTFRWKDLREKLTSNGLDLKKITEECHVSSSIWNLPFVYVYERSDLSVSFFAFQVYPETIRKALQDKSLENDLTGKFTLMVKYNKNKDQYLEINVELKPGRKGNQTLRQRICRLAMQRLLAENSEYRKTAEEYPKKVIPKIVCWPYEHDLHFRSGGKHKWVKK